MSFDHLSIERILLSTFVCVLACGDDDAGIDAAVDAAASDAPIVDAGTEADATTDGGADMSDAGNLDAGSLDAGNLDAGSPTAPWAWCPSAADFVGDAAWTDRIVVPDLTWCVMGDENRTIEEDRAGKAQLWVVAGEHPFPPREEASGAMTLPFCIHTADGEGPSSAGDGAFTVSVGEFLSQFQLRSSLDDDSEFSIDMFVERDGDMPVSWPGGALDGSLTGGFGAPGTASGSLMYGHRLGPCAGRSEWLELSAAATFGAGSVEFSYRAVPGSVQTGPSGGFRARGTLDGVAFDVDDYFRIFYEAEHHHFGGDYVVFFDAPIRDACGLRLRAGFSGGSLELVDCDFVGLEVIEDAAITGPFE